MEFESRKASGFVFHNYYRKQRYKKKKRTNAASTFRAKKRLDAIDTLDNKIISHKPFPASFFFPVNCVFNLKTRDFQSISNIKFKHDNMHLFTCLHLEWRSHRNPVHVTSDFTYFLLPLHIAKWMFLNSFALQVSWLCNHLIKFAKKYTVVDYKKGNKLFLLKPFFLVKPVN